METFIKELEKAFHSQVTTKEHPWDKHSKFLSFKVNNHDVYCTLGFPYKGEHTSRREFVCHTYIKTPELRVKERQSQNIGETTMELSKKVIKYLSKYNS